MGIITSLHTCNLAIPKDNITGTLVHPHPATICCLESGNHFSNSNHIYLSTSELLQGRKTWSVSKDDNKVHTALNVQKPGGPQ